MTIYDTIKDKLEDFPQFRERRFREPYLVKLALRDRNLEEKEVFYLGDNKYELTLRELADFAHTYTSYDRLWRKCLNENEHLRGKDWNDRRIYEEQAQINLGYEAGYRSDIKKLATL